MKSLSIKMLMMVVVLGGAMTSCGKSDSEKRIAELESRLADLEGTPSAATPATNTPATSLPKNRKDHFPHLSGKLLSMTSVQSKKEIR